MLRPKELYYRPTNKFKKAAVSQMVVQKAMVGTWSYLEYFPCKSLLEVHGGLEYVDRAELFHC